MDIRRRIILGEPRLTNFDDTMVSFVADSPNTISQYTLSFSPEYANGAGKPAPDNIREFLLPTGITIKNNKKNLLDKTTLVSGKYIDGTGAITDSAGMYLSDYIKIKDGKCVLSAPTASTATGISFAAYDADKEYLYTTAASSTSNNRAYRALDDSSVKYVRAQIRPSSTDQLDTAQLELGTVMTDYEPYYEDTVTLDFPAKPSTTDHTFVGGTITATAGQTSDFIVDYWYYTWLAGFSTGWVSTIGAVGSYTRFWLYNNSIAKAAGYVPKCNIAPSAAAIEYGEYSKQENKIGCSNNYLSSIWMLLPTSLVGTTATTIRDYTGGKVTIAYPRASTTYRIVTVPAIPIHSGINNISHNLKGNIQFSAWAH